MDTTDGTVRGLATFINNGPNANRPTSCSSLARESSGTRAKQGRWPGYAIAKYAVSKLMFECPKAGAYLTSNYCHNYYQISMKLYGMITGNF